MNLIKKLSCGVVASVFLWSMSPLKAIDQSHFYKLNQMQIDIMPPFENKVIFEKLPGAYKYLQELFFLSVNDKYKKDNVRGLIALRSFIEIICIQMRKIMHSNSERYSGVFIELIYSLYCSINVISCDIADNKIRASMYLERALGIYEQIDSNIFKIRELTNSCLYKYYRDIKTYMCLRYMHYCCENSIVRGVINGYASEKFSVDQITSIRMSLAKSIVDSYVDSCDAAATPVVETSSAGHVVDTCEDSKKPKEQQEVHEKLRKPDSKRARFK